MNINYYQAQAYIGPSRKAAHTGQKVDVPNSLFFSQGSVASGHEIRWVLFDPDHSHSHSQIKTALCYQVFKSK